MSFTFYFLCYFHTEPCIWCRTVYFACVLKEYTCILHISVRHNDFTSMFRTEPWWIRLIYTFYTNTSVYICLNQPTLKPLIQNNQQQGLKIHQIKSNQSDVITWRCPAEGAQTAYEKTEEVLTNQKLSETVKKKKLLYKSCMVTLKYCETISYKN